MAAETDKFILQLEALELKNMLKEEDDHRDAVVQFSPGAGGTESQIGLKCYIECTHGGPIKTDIRCQLWTIRMGSGWTKKATIEVQEIMPMGF